MTIRNCIDARDGNRWLTAFEEACDNAPAGTLENAKAIRNMLGEMCDDLIAQTRDLGAHFCNGDGIREIEILIFDNIRRNNKTGPVPTAIGFGLALQEQSYQMDRDTIIRRVAHDGDFYATREEWKRFGLIDQNEVPA